MLGPTSQDAPTMERDHSQGLDPEFPSACNKCDIGIGADP